MILKANNISKRIKGKVILDQISLSLESGHIYGFTGRNGSGKTMLFRALSGLIRIDEGNIYLDDRQLYKDMDVLPDLGLQIENAGLYPEYSGYDNLKMLASIKNIIGREEIRQAIKRVGLDPDDSTVVGKYSLGMRQRIILAQAIMEKPLILMLDEPTNALDEEGVQLIRTVINEEKERGAMILIASHSKEDISMLADTVFSMENGHLYAKSEA